MGTAQAADLLARIERFWQNGERHAVIITGNTGDDVIIGEHEGRLCDVLASHFAERFDVVLRYSLASGLRAEHGAAAIQSVELRGTLPLENALVTDALRVGREILASECERRIVFLIDTVDDLVPSGHGGAGVTDRAGVQQLERLGDDPRIVCAEHLVIAISADPCPALGRLTQASSRWLSLEIPPPDEATRYAVVTDVVSLENGPELNGLSAADVARLTNGMTGAELRHDLLGLETVDARAVHRMRAEAITRSGGGMLELIEPREGGWESTPGLDHVRRAFEELVLPDGLLSPFARDGVLLAGPPGCGKSISVKALAAERPIPCLTLADMRTRWYGESEQNMTRIFGTLASFFPCGVLIDEFDQMIGRRGEGADGTHDVDRRMFGKFLQFMEESRRDGSVLWIGATNLPTAIDEAMLARMPRVLPVLLPGPRARAAILQSIAHSFDLTHDEVDWDEISRLLPNAASRDLEHIVRRSALQTDGNLSNDAVVAVVRSWRPPRSLDKIHDWSLKALEHVRFTLDMPPLDDLPEHLEGSLG